MNLLIIGYCHLEDGFLYASNALEKLNYKIFFFPYLSYIMDKIVDRDELLTIYIKSNNINICLWWNNSIKYENYYTVINKLKDIHIKNYFFNWDPFLYNYKKYNSIIWKERIEDKEKIYPLMNHVFSCFEKEISYFKNIIQISYVPPGFDKNISKYIFDKDYECDISIICTNFYSNKNEFLDETTNITRYEIVNKLYENRSKFKFHIYGPENFKNIYPECYKGFIKYQECNKVFSNSKINLSIHPLIYELNNLNSKEEYFSERVPQILGSKGLLMTNSYFSDKLISNKDYIYINNDMDWYSKILDIIENSDSYDNIRNNGFNKGILYYQWDNWANNLSKLFLI
jgi:hypothetical protein